MDIVYEYLFEMGPEEDEKLVYVDKKIVKVIGGKVVGTVYRQKIDKPFSIKPTLGVEMREALKMFNLLM